MEEEKTLNKSNNQETKKENEKNTEKSTEKSTKENQKESKKSTKDTKKQYKNLLPFNNRTVNEQREIAKNGGIASGIARRQKKTIKDSLKMILEMKPTTKERELLESQGIAKEGDDSTRGDVIALVLYREAMKGNIRAIDNLLQIQTEIMQKEETKTTDIIGALNKTATDVWSSNDNVAQKEETPQKEETKEIDSEVNSNET